MSKDKAIRCLVDLSGIPPSRFALPDDGRKRNHLCQQRWHVAVMLARRAESDGTNTFQSMKTLVELTEIPKRTLHRVLNDLEKLGVLENHEYHPTFHTRVRSLHIAKLSPEITGFEEEKAETSVPNSGSTVPDRHATVPPSQASVPKSADFGTHTALRPPIQPPSLTSAREIQNLNSYSQIARWLPDDMKVAQFRRGEKGQIDDLISKHGGAIFLAALQHHWQRQDPESKLECKWTAFLLNFDGWLERITQAELDEQAQERWRKEHSEELERVQQESIERQTQEIIARRESRSPVAEDDSFWEA
jgi:hypothetical protein